MRIFFDIILVLSALTLPLPATLFLMCLGFFLFPRFVEAVAVAVFIELLYRGEGGTAWTANLPLAVLALSLLVVVEIFRSFVRERTT